jgi:hypothetical protein
MRWNTDGHYYKYVSQDIQQLPLRLQRSHGYPRQPEEMGEAMEEYLDGAQKPVYLPQKMAFKRYKTPPVRTGWLATAIASMAAVNDDTARAEALAMVGIEHVPIDPIYQRGPALDQFPQPMDRLNPNIDEAPPSSDMPTPGSFSSSQEITEYAEQYQQNILNAHRAAGNRAQTAVAEAKVQQAQVTGFIRPGR